MINNFDDLWEHRFQQLIAYKGIISLQSSLSIILHHTTTVLIEKIGLKLYFCSCCATEAKGDCCVPQFYPANTSLGIWVDAQRVRQRNGKLSQARINRLNTVGFTWSVKKKAETSSRESNDINQKMQSDDDSL